jgi:hypothetical protein
MLNRFLFAFSLGCFFNVIVTILIDLPYALYVAYPGAAVLGWYSDRIFDRIFGVR